MAKNKTKNIGRVWGGGDKFLQLSTRHTLNIVQCWDPYIVQRNQLADVHCTVQYIFPERYSF